MSFKEDVFQFLDIKNDCQRVFVTQLRDEEDGEGEKGEEYTEDGNFIQKYPIVKEKAGKLIELGYNTHSKTLLLKRQANVNKVDIAFQKKKIEFSQRMKKCEEQSNKLDQERKKLEQRIFKFKKFMEENDAKKVRALVKCEKEKKLKTKKEEELEELNKELEILKNKLAKFQNKISAHQIFEKYLDCVVDELSEDYLESGDDMVHSLMMRFETLSELNENLLTRRDELNKQLKEFQDILQDSSQQASQEVLLCNHQVAELRNQLEKLQDHNNEKEINYSLKRQKYISSSERLGQILLAIENLSSHCGKEEVELNRRYPTTEAKLNLIKAYMKDREDVYKMSLNLENHDGKTKR